MARSTIENQQRQPWGMPPMEDLPQDPPLPPLEEASQIYPTAAQLDCICAAITRLEARLAANYLRVGELHGQQQPEPDPPDITTSSGQLGFPQQNSATGNATASFDHPTLTSPTSYPQPPYQPQHHHYQAHRDPSYSHHFEWQTSAPPTQQPEMLEWQWQPYQPHTQASFTSHYQLRSSIPHSQWYPPSATNPPQPVQTQRPTSWDPPSYSQQSGFLPYDQPPPQYHSRDENQSPYGYGSASTYEREPYRQPRQPTCWDLPEQPIPHGVSAYNWQPPSEWPLPPPPTNELDPYHQPHLASLEQLNYSGRSYYVQQQGSSVEYHQQLPPQPVLDQPHPQQRSSSGWSLTSHCRSAAPLPTDVIPPSNLQHVSSASETVTNQLPNQAPVSAISAPMLSSCFLSFAPVSVRTEAGTTSLTNKSVVFGQATVPEQTISQSEPSIACAPQFLQKAHKDVEVVKLLSRTLAGDFDFTITNEKFKKDHVLSNTGESIRVQFKSTKGQGEALDHQSSTLDADARLIPPGMDMPYLGICGREDKIHVLALNYHNSKDLPLVSFDVAVEGRRSTSQCVFDPGGDSSLTLLFATLLVVSWFPP